jgi:hypothetical protein
MLLTHNWLVTRVPRTWRCSPRLSYRQVKDVVKAGIISLRKIFVALMNGPESHSNEMPALDERGSNFPRL